MTASVGVGLLGFGSVGQVVARRLVDDWQLLDARCGATPVLRSVAMRDLTRRREVTLPDTVRISPDPMSVVDDASVSVVVELISDAELAAGCIERALRSGKQVVTANRAVIAAQGPRLAELGAQHRAGLWFGASIAAGLPVSALLRDSLCADRVQSIDAVINDGSDGGDATHTLAIMVWLAFAAHIAPDAVERREIRSVAAADLDFAQRLGYAVKLVAHAAQLPAGLVCRVGPLLLPAGHPLHGIEESENAVTVHSDVSPPVTLRGAAGSRDSIAGAVLSDLVHAVRSRDAPPGPPAGQSATPASDEDFEICGYVRVALAPIPDAAALVVQALEDRGVPVADAVDAAESSRSIPQLLILTGSAPAAVHRRAVETLETLAAVREVVAALDRVEP